ILRGANVAAPKLAVVGASHFQVPLIQTAQRMGCEVHAFAWECGDPGESLADEFHPISIVETDAIVEECRRIGVDGICTIASDLATVAVCTVADALGLAGNSLDCMRVSTNKHLMREAFERGGDPSPLSRVVHAADNVSEIVAGMSYPLIVKPADRSGSRGITKLEAPGCPMSVEEAVRLALDQSFCKEALVEEFATGDEFSVEGMSWQGTHHILAITRKYTTGAPHFIETAHVEPAGLSPELAQRVRDVTTHALDTLGVSVGASHTELKIAPDGSIRIIEIGARMGGDCIGSHLVELSCGIDFVAAVVDAALGREPNLTPAHEPASAISRFIFNADDAALYERAQRECPELVRYALVDDVDASGEASAVTDSSTRLGHFVMASPRLEDLMSYLPDGGKALR
ncbi:MAG: ATP-grasp domain-containing protein, partial [Coriobacteriales bacterium]|nr:ATP-grasp domain-containing protein [Coriobacteriales bacterium]